MSSCRLSFNYSHKKERANFSYLQKKKFYDFFSISSLLHEPSIQCYNIIEKVFNIGKV